MFFVLMDPLYAPTSVHILDYFTLGTKREDVLYLNCVKGVF